MTTTVTVEGDLGTVDALTRLTTQGSVTNPTLNVPAGKSKITRIIAAAAGDNAAAGSAVFFLRIGGNAILNGEQSIMISAAGTSTVQAGSDQAPHYAEPIVIDDADIDVRPSDSFNISAEMAGSDMGTAHVVVTLVFA